MCQMIINIRACGHFPGKFMAKEDFYKGKWEGIRHAQAQNA